MHGLEWFITFSKWQQKQFNTAISSNHCMITNHFFNYCKCIFVEVYMYLTLKIGITAAEK